MIGWVEASLYEAINCLTRVGKNHIASDLNRLLDTLDFDELEVFRNPASEAIADQLLEVSTFPDLVELLRQFSEAIGVSHCTVHVVSELPSAAFTTRGLTTYSDEWVTRYFNRRYAMIDPVLRESATAEGGFFWDTLEVSDPNTLAFYHDAKAHGVGPSGYTLPVITERGDKIAISISSPEDREAFRDRVRHVEQDFLSVGFCITEAFSRLASEDRPSDFVLTDDQMMILRAVAMGAGVEELHKATYLYGSYTTLVECALRIGQFERLAIDRGRAF
jgi:Autoinducer binding domain